MGLGLGYPKGRLNAPECVRERTAASYGIVEERGGGAVADQHGGALHVGQGVAHQRHSALSARSLVLLHPFALARMSVRLVLTLTLSPNSSSPHAWPLHALLLWVWAGV